MSDSAAARYVAALLLWLLLALGFAPVATPVPMAPALEEGKALAEVVEPDPKFDLDEDGLINRDDPDDDGDGVPDGEDPKPYDPYDPKPWLEEDFRAPSDAASREALWGPMIGTYSTPFGGECFLFESGAQLCDYADGTAFVWIEEDWVEWGQYSDGSKEWLTRPADRPPSPPAGGSGGGDEEDSDDLEMLHLMSSRMDEYENEQLSQATLEAAELEISEKSVEAPKPGGGEWDHVKKVQQAQGRYGLRNGLSNFIRRMENKVNSGYLSPSGEEAWNEQLVRARRMLDHSFRYVPADTPLRPEPHSD